MTTIRYTADVADLALEQRLLSQVKGVAGQTVKASIESETATKVSQSSDKKKITIRLSSHASATATEEPANETSDLPIAPLPIPDKSASVSSQSPKKQSQSPKKQSQAVEIPNNIPQGNKLAASQSSVAKSIRTSLGSVRAVTKRAPLPANRTPKSLITDDVFEDFPQAAAEFGQNASGSNPGRGAKPAPRSVGLSASRAPSAKPSLKRMSAAANIQANGNAAIPLSQSLAQLAKRTRPDRTSNAEIDNFNNSPPSSPTAVASGAHVDASIFATPPRNFAGPLSAGSSVRRRNLLGSGSSNGLLVSLLQNARARVAQNWSSMAASEKRPSNDGHDANMLLKVMSVVHSSEHFTVICRIIEDGREDSLVIGDCVTCIIPIWPYDTRDVAIGTVLKKLGHVSEDSTIENAVLSIHRPWRLLRAEGVETASIVCCGLVTLSSVEQASGSSLS